MFTLQNTPPQPVEMAGLTASPVEVARGTAQHELTLFLRETEQGLTGALEYNVDLFDAATARRLLCHYQRLLEGIVEEPGQRVSRLPLMSNTERAQVLAAGVGSDPVGATPQSSVSYGDSLPAAFEAQVERTPDQIAASCAGESLTYRALNARANQLARVLRRLGVGPECVVGLCVERSLDMVVGILGILKAGGAYLPLDPSYPAERLTLMREDAGARILLTQRRLADPAPGRRAGAILGEDAREAGDGAPSPRAGGVRLIDLDADWEQMARESHENLPDTVAPDHLAYVIYTSGSTGRPKGVMITHANVIRLFEVTAPWFQFEAGDVWSQFHSFAFDFSVWEIWGALLHGGRAVIVPFDTSRSPQAFAELLARERVTVLSQTPTAFGQLARAWEDGGSAPSRSLRYVVFGGEALDLAGLRPWLAGRGDAGPLWVNMYGITETTVHVTHRPLAAADAGRAAGSMIGRPLPDLRLYVLDAHGQPVPMGVAGELYVGGAGLARGYLNRPELTAERFVPDPLSGRAGERLYRTGDCACWRPDGELEYLGRADDQVKIRGFRVEPGEIEAALREHTRVRDCAVAVQADAGGHQRLIGYVVARQEHDEDGAAPRALDGELRRYLSERLPDWMVPAAFVFLETLPLTAHGKLDRRGLPAPDLSRPVRGSGFVRPRNEAERRLSRLWESVLGIHPIGVRDSFFELGGHSLLAARLFAQIERSWGRNLPLATLFQAPTIEALARLLEEGQDRDAWSSLVPIQPEGFRPPLFCVHGIGGHVLGYRELARFLDPGQPVYGLQAQGLDGRLVRISVEEMAARYVAEIRAVQPDGPYALEGASFGGIVAFEMAQQFRAQGEEVALLALVDSFAPTLSRKKPFAGTVRRVGGHLTAACRLGPRAGLVYLSQRVRGVKKRLEWRVWKARHRAPPRQEYRLPRTLRSIQLAHRQSLEEYVPRLYPGRITLFRAQERPVESFPSPDRGWGELASAGVEIIDVPGNHLTMLERPHVQALAEAIQHCLDRIPATADGDDC
jgi:aspartate racemase